MIRTVALPTQLCEAACRRRSFTLTELLVVMGVMALLAGITVVGYRSISKDAKLSSGKNAVMAALDRARSMAMKNNRTTMVIFIPKIINNSEQRIEAVTAEWRGDVFFQPVTVPDISTDAPRIFERFTVVNGSSRRPLPAGINVAGPNYKMDPDSSPLLLDKAWFTPSNLRNPKEAPGRLIAVLYSPDGTTQTAVAVTATLANNYPFVDFDNDGFQDRTLSSILIDDYYIQLAPTDEPCAEIVAFLAVFDEDQARELYDTSKWDDATVRMENLSDYINSSADRIHFNRYTGVAMK